LNEPESNTAAPLGDGRYARVVDRPETQDALRQCVAQRAGEGLAVYPQGGKTALDYGGPPRLDGALIDLRSLDRVIDYPAADMTITVEAGITLAKLQAVLADAGQRLPLDAPKPEQATLGGIFATNTSGPRRFGAGRPRDQILGVRFVTADGTPVQGGGRVVKNVAGYDLPKLLTGSLGTLGVISEMTLKVRPKPDGSALVWARFATAEALDQALERLNTSRTRPIALEVLNGQAARLIGARRSLPASVWVLIAGFEGNAVAVAWQAETVRNELDALECHVLDGPDASPLWADLTEFQAEALGPLSFEANLRPSAVLPFLNGLDRDRWSAQAHAGSGIVRAHALGEWSMEEVAGAIGTHRAEAVQTGGNLVLSRCPTDWKEPLNVWGEPRGDWTLARQLKQALDPGGLMNPGRFLGIIE
jgi:glycolate oxidase FAD binding subunit